MQPNLQYWKTIELALRWVFVLEGLGDLEKYGVEFQINGDQMTLVHHGNLTTILNTLEEENKDPFLWNHEERVEFISQIIQNNGTTHPIHRPTTAV